MTDDEKRAFEKIRDEAHHIWKWCFTQEKNFQGALCDTCHDPYDAYRRVLSILETAKAAIGEGTKG